MTDRFLSFKGPFLMIMNNITAAPCEALFVVDHLRSHFTVPNYAETLSVSVLYVKQLLYNDTFSLNVAF